MLHEPVAGRADAVGSHKDAARREALEKSDLILSRLFAASGHYPSPGIIAEYIYRFFSIADLPDDAATVSGIASEDEDIRAHVFPRAGLTKTELGGRIRNAPYWSLLCAWSRRSSTFVPGCRERVVP